MKQEGKTALKNEVSLVLTAKIPFETQAGTLPILRPFCSEPRGEFREAPGGHCEARCLPSLKLQSHVANFSTKQLVDRKQILLQENPSDLRRLERFRDQLALVHFE